MIHFNSVGILWKVFATLTLFVLFFRYPNFKQSLTLTKVTHFFVLFLDSIELILNMIDLQRTSRLKMKIEQNGIENRTMRSKHAEKFLCNNFHRINCTETKLFLYCIRVYSCSIFRWNFPVNASQLQSNSGIAIKKTINFH